MQRLSGLDASFLYLESPSQLMQIGCLFVVDPATMPEGYSFHRLRSAMAERISGLPEMRRKLVDSVLNLGHPGWVDQARPDIEHHVHHVAVPAPGGPQELAEFCAHLAGQPLDRSRPLWEMWVIEGLADGSIGVYLKLHHCTVDGATGMQLIRNLCTAQPEPADEDWNPLPSPGTASLLGITWGGLRSAVSHPLMISRLVPRTLGIATSWVGRARRGEAMPAPFTAPRVSFNRTITSHRSIAFASVDFADIRTIKNATGATVNDVVMAVAAGGLRKYLEDRRELPEESMVAIVPVSIHEDGEDLTVGGTNRLTAMFTKLHTHIADPLERLQITRDSNRKSKAHHKALNARLLTDWAEHGASAMLGMAVRYYSQLHLAERHPVIHNMVVSNVPGPNRPMYFLGARIRNMYLYGPVFDGAGMNLTILSLDGKVGFGIQACRELAPDLWGLAGHLQAATTELLQAISTSDDLTADEPVRPPAH